MKTMKFNLSKTIEIEYDEQTTLQKFEDELLACTTNNVKSVGFFTITG